MQSSRREFLRKLAHGAVYAAPVVYSLRAPAHLLAQGPTGKGEMKGGGGGGGGMSAQVFPSSPGSTPPPGS